MTEQLGERGESEGEIAGEVATCRPTTGASTASYVVPRFSMTSGSPFSSVCSRWVSSSFCPSRATLSPCFSSRFLIHVMPCSCGSIISGQRAQLHTIAPFSTLTRSEGRSSEFHTARSASVVRILSGSAPSERGTPPLAAGTWLVRYGR